MPDSLPLFCVEAFADEPFTGNPAAIVLLGDCAPSTEWMQAVAAEINLSETAFVNPPALEGGEWTLRWFTPSAEVDLCGHATLAAAHVLWQQGCVAASDEVRFHTPRANHRLRCQKLDDRESPLIRIELPARAIYPADAPVELEQALGARICWSGQAENGNWVIELANADTVAELKPDFRSMLAATSNCVLVTAAPGPEGADICSRFFAPGLGIEEDPVTGSAHAILGPLWSNRLGLNHLVCRQLSARGARLELDLIGDRVGLAGRARTSIVGEWCLALHN